MRSSPLVTEYIPSPATNHYGKRTSPIKRIIVHHMAAVWTARRCALSFTDEKRRASATYCIGNDGEIVQCLDEDTAPATTDSYKVDNESITIEVSNSKMGDDWPVSDAALVSLIKLCVDVARRNNLGKLTVGKNLCYHSMYAATACPGPYLISKMSYIEYSVNKENGYFDGTLAGNDITRGTNDLVLYFKGLTGNGKTGTNKWGYEVAIDKNGVVLEDPHYSGNTVIPEGGKVLSGHGESGEWIKNNIKKGYHVWFDTAAHVTKSIHHSIDHFNGIRGADELVVYNKGERSDTNMWGWEVAVNAKGHVVKKRYGGKTDIPEGGFVLSGHGDAAKWINKNIKVGDSVKVIGNMVQVK